MGERSYWQVAKRTARQFLAHNLTDWAAALTYYAILGIFPALIVLVSILGLVGESATQPLMDNVAKLAPGPAREIFVGAVEEIERNQGTAGVLFVVGLAGALWSASGYVGAFMNASNVIYGVEEGRPFWKKRPVQLGVTVALVLMTAAVGVALVLTGPLARTVGDIVGVGDTAVTVWSIAKWPVMVGVVITMLGFLYWVAPNVKQPKFRWLTPGGVLALATWLLASAGFAFYVANFGSYSKTYGALGGVIVFLVWLWITNLAVLFGAEFDAELERQRELEEGLPAQKDIQLPPRDEPKPA